MAIGISLALLLSWPTAAFGQAGTGAVTGSITDPAGAAFSGAPVAVTHQQTSQRLETTTDATGRFRIENLTPGLYNLLSAYRGGSIELRFQIIQPRQTVDIGALVLTPAQSAAPPPQQDPASVLTGQETPETVRESMTVTARRVEEEAQDVPVPVSVITGDVITKAAAFNINRIKELIPTVQFYSSNPRNSAINIRGLGAPFGLTNDGIDPGVGYYVDGVFYARPAAATLDFIDIEQIEISRGPQGVLFGKNTTAGAINVRTRRPTFRPETNFELSFGNYGYVQAKGAFSGPIVGNKLAGRVSFVGTQRDGFLFNVRDGFDVNDLNNLGIRGQILYLPKPNLSILLSGDVTRQRPRGYAQVIAGVAPTKRPANRQYGQMAQDLGYTPPSFYAYDRLIDTDSQWRSTQDMGGASVEINWDRGSSQLTSISSWRFWDWKPSNDRDFTGLPITTISAAPSYQTQWTQELRYAGRLASRTNFLIGAFYFGQRLNPSGGGHKQEQGSAAARWLLAPTPAAATPGLLDGYGQNVDFDYRNTSAAVFGQIEYAITERLKIAPGLRYNYDVKNLNYNQIVYGGLQTTDPALIALQRSVLAPLAYAANVDNHNLSGQVTLSYKLTNEINTYGTYATGFKPVGLNLGGVPTDAAGNPIISAATVRPEKVRNWEVGIKTQPRPNMTANFALFDTNIKDFQTQVVNAQVGVLRGYLANAERVRVRGIEFDGSARINPEFTVYTAVAFTDGRYMSFPDAPPPLEETGGPQVVDVSGSVLPGISKWAFSIGGEYVKRSTFLSLRGEYFIRLDASFRSRFSSNPSSSAYLNAPSYALFNPRVGFRTQDGWIVALWARNILNKNYFELLSPQPGNSGLYEGLPGDPRTFGITISRSFNWQ